MYKTEFISRSLEDTAKVGNAIAGILERGDTVALYGDMASGKTALSRFIFEAKGFASGFSSPTYAIINEYTDLQGGKAYHIDAYRLSSAEELLYAGVDELTDAVLAVIEWADIVEEAIPEDSTRVHIYKTDDINTRRMDIFVDSSDKLAKLNEALK